MDCKLQDWLKGWVHSLQKAYADVAQLAEQLICNQQVIGSSPTRGANCSIADFAIEFFIYASSEKKLAKRISRSSQDSVSII